METMPYVDFMFGNESEVRLGGRPQLPVTPVLAAAAAPVPLRPRAWRPAVTRAPLRCTMRTRLRMRKAEHMLPPACGHRGQPWSGCESRPLGRRRSQLDQLLQCAY